MSRLSAFCLIICAAGFGFVGCNTTSETLEYEVPTSALVKSFSLSADTKVLDNLDKVFFSIDLVTGNIFNADSMPYGTKTDKLVPVITTGGASAVELVVPRPGQSDTTYNYLENSTDSIDFSSGPVKRKIQSLNESVTKVYTIKVNVHNVKSDSLSWGDIAYMELPTSLPYVEAQHTLKFKGKAYCLTSEGNNYCLASSDNPAAKIWEYKKVTFGQNMKVSTFRASNDAMYILDIDGNMYKSADLGESWTQTGQKYEYLIGGYGDIMLGTVKDGDKWKIAGTDGSSTDAPAEFPVTGTSVPLEYTFPMSSTRQLTVVGGVKASGELTGCAWGFDGSNWACLSSAPLPDALEGVTLVPYYVFAENEYWVATKESIFVAIGGKNDTGECNTTTYISYDYGMSWRKGSDLMQLPKYVPGLYDAQTLVFTSELGSRASEAITSWECPYIYMFGGEFSNGLISNTVWRGVINRLSFKPLQ